MKIIEARDGFINFEADESIYLSSFIRAKGMDKSYIAQVSQKKKFGNIVIASAKILFLYSDNQLMDYDRTLPSKDCELEIFPYEVIQASVQAKNPVIVGKTLDNTKNIYMDLAGFNKSFLISVDDKEINNTLVHNLSKQFEHLGVNTVIIDTLGVTKDKKYIPGKDFKLPLDPSTLEFMFKSCLNDATEDSKATIAEVFRDLSEYSKTVSFLPFKVLKSIIDEMVDKQHIFKLFVLKNRLANFERLGYFASNNTEVDNINKILSEKNVIIDLSKLNPVFQNKFLENIYTKIDTKRTQILLELANTVSKKNLKTVISDSEAATTIVTHSKYQYLADIKNMFKNFIIEPSASNNEIFKEYFTFFSSMTKGMYLVAGEGINYIPMVSTSQDISDTMGSASILKQSQYIKEEDDDAVSVEPEKEEEIVSEEVPEENSISEAIPQHEIIAEIDEKSNEAIDSISEKIIEPSGINLFDDEDEDTEENAEEELEAIEEIEETETLSDELSDKEITEQPKTIDEVEVQEEIEEDEQEDIIEPEYVEVNEDNESASDITNESDEPIEIHSGEGNIDLSENDLSEKDLVEDDLEVSNLAELEQEDEVSPEDILLDNDSDEMLENIAEADELHDEGGIPEYNDEQLDDTLALDNGEESSINAEVGISEDDNISVELSNDEELLLEQVEEGDEISDTQPTEDVDFNESPTISLEENDFEQVDNSLEEITSEDMQEDDILIDLTEDGDIGIDEDVDRQIVEDVDKVFTTIKPDSEFEEISDSDLDFIDELNNDSEELEEYSDESGEISDIQPDEAILEQPAEGIVPPRQPHKEDNEILEKRDANTPIVPVYDADIPQEDMVVSDEIQQGDSVVHAKYGNGVVEKMIKYGTKTLYSINFENIGRRLLDPTLTEIKKL